ncbi:HAD-like domain-containing protein [Aspergillus keveii]|uniref:HAD-like domain-containing protein n=1 Tax=Aspergillus keveii TaxID=714993 RepID=A0ABR4FYB6_9EURO
MVRALILDLGDVLFNWDAPASTPISRKTLGQMLHSEIWGEYERGHLTEEEAYNALAMRYSCEAKDVAHTFVLARESLRLDTKFKTFLQTLKQNANGSLRVYGMSNISKPDFEVLLGKADDWTLFDKIFPSGHVGMRKPDLEFFRYVLRDISTPVEDVVFVDDNLDNVTSARSLGLRSILFHKKDEVQRQLANIFGSPAERGLEYLSANKTNLQSETTTNIPIQDNFGQLLILEATEDPSLVSMEPGKRTWNFFIGSPSLTTDTFPDDLDTTSLALSIVPTSPDIVNSVIDEIISRRDKDGIVPTYFDNTRPRVDPIVCVNVLSMFAKYGREHDLPATVAWVRDVLYHRAYLGGTRYYGSAEAFLFFFTRFVRNLRPGTLKQDLHALLSERVRERINTPVDALALSMRIQACHALGFDAPADVATLITMQDEDGGWPAAVIYKYGAGGLGITNRGVSTAFAVKAITGTPVKIETSVDGSGNRAVASSMSPELARLQPISSVGDWIRFIIASLHVHLAWLWNVLLLSKVV